MVRPMQIFTDEHKDLRLLDLRGLTPLDADIAAGEMDLVGMIEEHNTRCIRAGARMRQLAEERLRLSDFNAARNLDGAALLAERARLRGERWDGLWEVRHALEEREGILAIVQQRLRERYYAAYQEHQETIAGAERRLATERRRLERTNPATAGSHFAELVEDDAQVQAAAKRNATSRRAFEDAAEARRNLVADIGVVTRRQHELFRALMV